MIAFILKLLLAIFGAGVAGRYNDGAVKFSLVIIVPLVLGFMWGNNWGIFVLGLFVLLCLGKPFENQIYNTCQLRRSYGTLFDIAGILLMIVSIIRYFL